jgi:hypothetical protein
MRFVFALLFIGCAAAADIPEPPQASSAPTLASQPLMDWTKRVGAGCESKVDYEWLTSGELALTCGRELELLSADKLESVGLWKSPSGQLIRTVSEGPGGVIWVLAGDQLWSLARSDFQSGARSEPDGRFDNVKAIIPTHKGRAIAVIEAPHRLSILPADGRPAVTVAETFSEGDWVSPDTLVYCAHRIAEPASANGLFVFSVNDWTNRHLVTTDGCQPIGATEDANWFSMGDYRFHLRSGARKLSPQRDRSAASGDTSKELEDCLTRKAARDSVTLENGNMIRPSAHGFGLESVARAGTEPSWATPTNEPVTELKLSPSGNRVIGRCGAEALCAWDAIRGTPLLLQARGVSHASPIIVLSRAENGEVLVSGSRAGDVIAWDLSRGTMARLPRVLRPRVLAYGRRSHFGDQWECVREPQFSADVAVEPSGDTAVVTSNSRTHVFRRELGAWSELHEQRNGAYVGSRYVFAHRKFWVSLDRPDAALKHAVVVTERAPTVTSSAKRVIASRDQGLFAIDTGTALELRSADPFGALLNSVRLAEPLAMSHSGECILGTNGLWCEGSGLRVLQATALRPSLFRASTSEVLFSTSSDVLEGLYPTTRTLARLSTVLRDVRMKMQPPLLLTDNEVDRSDFEHWQVNTASVHTQASLMFVWSNNWFVRANHGGSLLFERAPGTGVALELVPLTELNAAYVLASDGRYDVIGPEAAQAELGLACFLPHGAPGLANCGAKREPGLMASVLQSTAQ